ncbi:MAG: alanyl-tRNA editing protein [Anaerovoracaceae bacterium]
MTTTKLYQEDVYMKSGTATVVRCLPASNGAANLYLDRTMFFPEGGGQSCDLGTIDSMKVIDVQEEGDEVRHTVKLNGKAPEPGDEVALAIDWERRFDNMQRHCGEHILSGMFHREYGGVNRGFHMGDEYMTIDISLEDDPAFAGKELTMEIALNAELCTNRAIWQDLPVVTRRFRTKAEAEGLPLRKKLTIEKDISIVSVGSIENPSDCVACCGTHPSTSGQVGLVKIFRVEKNKDMYRVYFEAGQRALADYDAKHEIVTELGSEFSAGSGDLLKKIRKQKKQADDLHAQMTALKKMVSNQKAKEISAASGCYFVLDPLTADDGMHIGKQLERPFTALHDKSSHTLLLFSDGSVDCGALVKASGLKGGGRPRMARMIGNDEELLAAIKEYI